MLMGWEETAKSRQKQHQAKVHPNHGTLMFSACDKTTPGVAVKTAGSAQNLNSCPKTF